jgi:hypothetical protein
MGLLYNEQEFYLTPCLSYWNDTFKAIEISWLKFTLSIPLTNYKLFKKFHKYEKTNIR